MNKGTDYSKLQIHFSNQCLRFYSLTIKPTSVTSLYIHKCSISKILYQQLHLRSNPAYLNPSFQPLSL